MTLSEPNYYLTDSSGNRIGAIGVDNNGNPVVEHVDSGQQVAVTADGLQADSGSFNSLSTDDINITAHASGSESLSAGGRTSLNASSDYNSGYYDVIFQNDNSGGGGDLDVVFSSNGASNGVFIAEEKGGSAGLDFSWKIVKISD